MTFPNPIEGYLLFVLGITALVAFHMENYRLMYVFTILCVGNEVFRIFSSIQASQAVETYRDLLPVFYVYEAVMLIIFGIGCVQSVLIARIISARKLF